MTREHAREIIPLIQAFADGREIQFNTWAGSCDWDDCRNPSFACNIRQYRVKPEPRRFTIMRTEKGFVVIGDGPKPGESIKVEEVAP